MSYQTGTYRNVFLEIGKTEAQIEEKLKEAFDTFFL